VMAYPGSQQYPPTQQQQYPPPGAAWYPQSPSSASDPYPSQQPPYGQPPPTGQFGPPPPASYYGGGAVGGGAVGGGAPQQQQPPSYGTTTTATNGQPPGWCGQYSAQIPPHELQELQQWFRMIDRDGSGAIAANELANVAVGGTVLGIDNGIKLIRVFDADGNGSIDFKEYASLHRFLLSMQQTYRMQDKDGNGRLDAGEIHQAIMASGFNMPCSTSHALYTKYNSSGMGLNMVEWISLVAHIALARSLLERLDFDRDGRITVNLDMLYELSASF